ncbi:hypothetical protein CBS101457_001549 [Exobasidium rhododendri]|nr:hypothetical protein CBS101457_001549 [Exobasidium rhododendri]
MSMFDVHDLTNKVDVGSQAGTMWSLSSQKQGHGIPELRDDDTTKLWQSDGFLPHFINIQFAQRTAVTHVSIYTDFRLDDSYTPIKIRILAGTHHHDLVEVRSREFVQPTGWKHFVMDKFDSKTESEESNSDSSSSSTRSDDDLSDSTMDPPDRQKTKHRPSSVRREGPAAGVASQSHSSSSSHLPFGVSRKHAPIHAYLVQICIIANHAVGKDTHIRGIKIFGPPTAQSRDKAKRDVKKNKESRRVTGSRAVRQRKEKDLKKRKRAMNGLVRWVQDETEQPGGEQEGDDDGGGEVRRRQLGGSSISTTRGLELLSTLR